MTVQRSQASVKRGQEAAYTVQVSTENNGSASDVSVALTAQPSSQKPAFTSGCAKGNGATTCSVSSVTAKQPASLRAQIPVAADASTVTSVTLTAAASVVTPVKWTPPSAAVTVAVTAAAASPASSPASSPQTTPGTAAGAATAGAAAAGVAAGVPGAAGTTLPLGPVPDLNNVSGSLIGAGNASGLFPLINPSATPGPVPGVTAPDGRRNTQPVAQSSAIGFGQPTLTGQVAGLLALAFAILLTVTRLSLRRRFRSRRHGSG